MHPVIVIKLTFYLILFFLQKIKNTKIYYQNFQYILKNYSAVDLFKFFSDNKINPSKNYYFKKFTTLNSNLWKDKKNYKAKNKKFTLVTSFVHLPEDVIPNTIIAKYVQNLKKNEIIGILDQNDIQGEVIMRSFGIKKFVFINNPPFISNILLFIKSFFILEKLKKIKNFLKYKNNKIYFGKIVVEHVIRHTGNPFIKKINFKVCYHLAQAFFLERSINKVFKNFPSESIVMSENQFLPSGVIFQNAIKNKISVYGRHGAPKKISIIKFSKLNEIYTARAQVSKKIFNKIIKKQINKISNLGKKNYLNKIKFGKDSIFKRESVYVFKNIRKNYSKNEICKQYNWNNQMKILGIYAHTFLDGNYVQGWRTFTDNYEWLKSTLEFASKQKKFNFIVKPHPMDHFYTKSKMTTADLIQKFVDKYENIKFFPKDMTLNSGLKIIDVAITSHGTVSLEFLCFGKPCITAGRTSWGDVVLNEKPISKRQYFDKIKNAEKLNKPSKKIIKKLFSYIYIQDNLMAIDHPLLADILVYRNVDRNKYWKKNLNLFKNYNLKNDLFRKNFEYQVKKNYRHTINLAKFKKLNV